ncbi:adenylate kinase [Nocardia asteroides]|uniref:Adenylate kinase n=1 Tax=Nocardia asteroides NBRC 15531 TaxID=1110697 RepID=U5E5U9_NOCAS|nr:adenylate kinase [Nocardia asteroides]TLF65469.1 adenylate kinase [Nocardia asteroides NBRC 15531]UGT47773.1 adenylate kinase [Nocardia asteroides]SFM55171.1 Adenylate kinase [Nocardia asteroides]VEG33305.1 Adenylate kinase [Nocardia asteroides]GAD82515.1 adenylate kinase [Nocardia asteroides NBRC 15531]
MRVVLLGPPGAGKGTQAVLLSEKLGVPHISTGDLFRANISQQTALGREAQKYMDAGDLVPSDVTNRMVEARVAEPDAANGFVLDGYPRTVDQADALKKILEHNGTALDAVLCFVVAEDTVVERMLARGRADDTEDVIRNRLRVYREETEPLLEYYDGLVVTVDGIGEVDEVNTRALKALGH